MLKMLGARFGLMGGKADGGGGVGVGELPSSQAAGFRVIVGSHLL